MHSVARRAAQTAAEIAAEVGLAAAESEGIHEVQAGELENRNDDDAIAEFNAIYQRWHQGEVDVPMPGGENARDVLDRYLPVITDLRLRYLDNEDWTSDIVVVSHGAAIRLTAATLAGVDSSFVLDHHLANAEVGGAGNRSPTVGGRLPALGRQDTAVLSRTGRAPRRGRLESPTRWADRLNQTASRCPLC